MITSCTKKLSLVQPASTVYFGKAGGNLPWQLVATNALGMRVGVEFGFQSTTLDINIARNYGKDWKGRLGLSHVFAMKVRSPEIQRRFADSECIYPPGLSERVSPLLL